MTRFQVAAMLDAHHDTVAQWEREGLPVAERGSGGRASRYAIPDVVRWYVAHARAKYQGAGVLDLDAERAALAASQRERIDLQNAVRRGELLELAVVEATVAELLLVVRARLLALPAALAERLAAIAREGGARGLHAELTERVTEALSDLAAWRPTPGGPQGNR